MRPSINLSLNLTYYCNFRCSFCYLTEEQLSDRTKLSLDLLKLRLDEVMETYDIGHVDVYGGEVLLLPEEYLLEMKEILLARGIDDIVLVTNLSHVPDIVHDPAFDISVSYDFDAREKADLVLQNIYQLSNRFNILTLASRKFLDTVSVDEYVATMNSFPHLKGCEIKPYSTNQANADDVKYTEFEDFVWAVVKHPGRKFYFENETQINESISKTRNAFSDDHLYITPLGDFAVLEFDENEREYFLIVGDIQGYQDWTHEELIRVDENDVCGSCPYYGSCLSEHLRHVDNLDHSCNGFRNLLERAEADGNDSGSRAAQATT